jgi:sugar phosphate isomerase/epimerase
MARLSISSWSLHRLLGRAWYDRDAAGEFSNRSDEKPEITLLDLPGEAAKHGIGTIELCHFHFPTDDASYLDALVDAITASNVELFSILIDTGDISHYDPESRKADFDTNRYWIDVAAGVGAEHVRIIAGDADPDALSIGLSVDGLRELSVYAEEQGVKTLTENFKKLAQRPETVLEIIDRCEGRVGLCADFGNFPSESRPEDLARVLPKANSIHAKADYPGGEMNREAYTQNVKLAVDAGFDGPMSLIYQDADDVWTRLEEMKDVTAEVLAR